MLGLSYNLLGTIEAPCDTVNALAFSNDGRYLASASNDMVVRVYDVKRHLSPTWTYHGKSPFTTVVWCKEHLFAGNGDGEIMIFYPVTHWFGKRREQIISEFYSPIYCLELNRSGDQLLVCSGARTTLLAERKSGHWKLMYHFDSPSTFEETAELGEPDGFDEPQVLATSAHFLHEKECVVIGYLHHGLWKHQIETGTAVLVWGPDEKIGFTALSPDGTALVVSNVRSGIDWLRVYAGSTRWKKISTTLEIQDLSANIPLPVLFIDKGKYILMGTSKGYAIIFHAKHGKRVISLDHGSDKTRVTALAYVHPKNCPQLIATGDGNCGPNTKIKVWIEDTEEKRIAASPSGRESSNFLQLIPEDIQVRSIVGTVYNVSAVIGVMAIILLLLPAAWKEELDIPIAKTLLIKYGISKPRPFLDSILATLDTGPLDSFSTSSPAASTANGPDPTSIVLTLVSANSVSSDPPSFTTQYSDGQGIWDRIFG
ncbi:WD40-repeat-containing domain protein [Lentinula edodes]|nr:WD40-repeat-containing domain protein [Lentinula edodes]